MQWIKVFVIGLLCNLSFGQSQLLNSKSAILTKFGYKYQIPGGDLADRFGSFGGLSGGIDYLFPSGNWMLSSNYTFHFGSDVKVDVLGPLRNERGHVVGSDGFPTDIVLRQRAYSGSLKMNYLFDLLPDEENDLSLVIGLGGGYIQHWIRIQDERNTATQLRQPYEAGYDRLTRGFTTNQYIGIQFLQANRRVNFYAGFEFIQAYTKGVRPWNYDTREVENSKRIDLLNGLSVGWIFPFYLNQNAEVLYY